MGTTFFCGTGIRAGTDEKDGLSAGRIWYDFNTGKRYEGKQYYLVDAPLDTCPMFAKAGSMIPAYEVVQYVGEKPYDTLNMLVFPGEGTMCIIRTTEVILLIRMAPIMSTHSHSRKMGK